MANKLIEKAQKLTVPIRIKAIPREKAVWLAWTDSSLANVDGGSRTQLAYVIALADECVKDYLEGDVSVITCHSHKMCRAASSTMFAETVALSEGIAALEFWMQWWEHAWQLKAPTMAIAKIRAI
eukprot:5155548-Amphidinium_carterae.1